jgi:hypothetical protein
VEVIWGQGTVIVRGLAVVVTAPAFAGVGAHASAPTQAVGNLGDPV